MTAIGTGPRLWHFAGDPARWADSPSEQVAHKVGGPCKDGAPEPVEGLIAGGTNLLSFSHRPENDLFKILSRQEVRRLAVFRKTRSPFGITTNQCFTFTGGMAVLRSTVAVNLGGYVKYEMKEHSLICQVIRPK